jgi:hypothetical protein
VNSDGNSELFEYFILCLHPDPTISPTLVQVLEQMKKVGKWKEACPALESLLTNLGKQPLK